MQADAVIIMKGTSKMVMRLAHNPQQGSGLLSPSLRSQKDYKSHTLCPSLKCCVSEHTCNHFNLKMEVICCFSLMNLGIWALLNSWPFSVPHLKTTCSLGDPQKLVHRSEPHALPSFVHASNKYRLDSANMDWIQQIWIGCHQCYRYSFDGRDIEINNYFPWKWSRVVRVENTRYCLNEIHLESERERETERGQPVR